MKAKVGGYVLEQKTRSSPHVAYFSAKDRLGRTVEVACYRGSKLGDRISEQVFKEEAKRTAALTHESLLPLLDAGTEGDIWYSVAMLADAPSLEDLVKRGGPLAPDRVALVAEKVLSALEPLHRAGVRHGDLSSAGIYTTAGRVMVRPRRWVPLTPKERDPATLAPEEAKGSGSDIRSDLYSLGVVLSEALCGQPPFSAATLEERLQSLNHRPGPVPTGTPEELASVIEALLAPSPDERPADPSEALRILHGRVPAPAPSPATAAPATPTAPPTPVAPRLPSRPRTTRRGSGRLVLAANDRATVWEILDEETWLSLAEPGRIAVTTHEVEAPAARIDRSPERDVFVALPDSPVRPRINGSLVDEHVLEVGDEIQLGEAKARYETGAIGSAPRAAPQASPRTRTGHRVAWIRAAVCLLAIGVGLWQLERAVSRGSDVIAEAHRVRVADRASADTGEGEHASKDSLKAASMALADARSFADGHSDDPVSVEQRFQAVAEKWAATPYGAIAKREATREARRAATAAKAAYDKAAATADSRIGRDHLYDAYLAYRHFEERDPSSLYGKRAGREALSLKTAIKSRFDEDMRRAEAAEADRDLARALDILEGVHSYASPLQCGKADDMKDSIQARIKETQESPDAGGSSSVSSPTKRPAPTPKTHESPAASASSSPAPPAKAAGHPAAPASAPAASIGDEKKAARIFDEASREAKSKQWKAAAKSLTALAKLSSTRFYKAHSDEIENLEGRVRIETLGYAALFHGEVKSLRGLHIDVFYSFDKKEEAQDWTYVKTFAYPGGGTFTWQDGHMEGDGAGTAVGPGVFSAGSLTMRARIKTQEQPHDLGLVFFEPEEMLRCFLYSIQNRYFTLGLERSRLDENVIWVMGGGAWATKVKGETGFVRVAHSPNPQEKAGTWIKFVARKEKNTVSMTIDGTTLRGSAFGDDRYVFLALRPALYVLGSEGEFDDVELDGTLDAAWAKQQMKMLRDKYGD